MWQAMKDKKRRLAQNYKERRRSTTDEDVGIARSIPFDGDFVDERSEFKEYVKSTKDIQRKVAYCSETCVAFLEAFKAMAETFDEMEGGYDTSRGEKWLADVDRFQASAAVQIEGSTATLLEVLAKRHQAATETQQGIKQLVDRETDLRSYERRVHEANTAAKPKPETIQKFQSKLENAKQDCLSQTTQVKADLQFMTKTKLTTHQPVFNDFFTMLMHVLTKTSELANPEDAKARLHAMQQRDGSTNDTMNQAKAKVTAMGASAKAAGMAGIASMAALAGNSRRPSFGQGVHDGQPMMEAPPRRAAPVPGQQQQQAPATNERALPKIPPGTQDNGGVPPPLPPKESMSQRASSMGMSGLTSARSGLASAKTQAQQHKDKASQEQKAAGMGMAMGFVTGGKKGAMNSAKGSLKTAAKSHGTELAKNVPPPNKAAPTPMNSFASFSAKAKQAGQDVKKSANANLGKIKNKGKQPSAKALFDFEPENPDELKLAAGDEIFDLEIVEDDWMRGVTADGRSGVFPSNYVEKL
jgi:hypothetical protein